MGQQIGTQREHHLRDQSHKAQIIDQARKFLAQMHLDMLGVVRLVRSIVRLVKMDQNRHRLTWTEVALDYARTRMQFNRPIGSFQLVEQKLAMMATELVKAQLLTLQLGRNMD